MTVRVRSMVNVVASIDDDEKLIQFRHEDETLTTVITTYAVEESGTFQLNANEADYVLPKGKVGTAALLFIEINASASVKLDGVISGHAMTPETGKKAVLFLQGAFTAAPLITNLTAAPAEGKFFIAGAKA